MSSLERMLGILDAYTEAAPVWTVDQFIARFDFTKSTAYRYVKELCDAGLLAPVGNSGYILGPKIIDLDRQIRLCDPLIIAGRRIVAEILPKCGEAVALLCSLYGDSVICVYRRETPIGLNVSYARGRPVPLYRGSASRVILAHRSERVLARLQREHGEEIRAAGLGETWKEFRTRMRMIRSVRVYQGHSELDPGVFGLSAPIFNADNKIFASFTLAIAEARSAGRDVEALSAFVVQGADRLTREIAALAQKAVGASAARGEVIPAESGASGEARRS